MHTNAHVSERAAREIFLKGFEVAVKRSQPMSIMTSYNLVNGIHTANSYELLTAIARQEWGFKGFVMTDWGTTGSIEMEQRPDHAGQPERRGRDCKVRRSGGRQRGLSSDAWRTACGREAHSSGRYGKRGV